MIAALAFPAFVAGVLTFLAPCTLPLVPGYLGFISGVPLADLADPAQQRRARHKILLNGVLYVVGFSVVFIALGSIIGFIGGSLFAEYRLWLTRIGGSFIILFGVLMLQAAIVFYEDRWPLLSYCKIPWIANWAQREYQAPIVRVVKPGSPLSAALFGATFAVGWTPCIGPVLGAILTLAATRAGLFEGAVLLALFSLGLGVPFIALAASISAATRHIERLSQLLPLASLVGGLLIVFLGVLIATDHLGIWVAIFFRMLGFLSYEQALLEHL